MKIITYINNESWLPNLTATTQRELFETMVGAMFHSKDRALPEHLDAKDIVLELEAREARQSTALGHGIAFPHARLSALTTPHVAFGVLASPLLFGDQPTSIICIILSPLDAPSLSLKVMSQFSRMLISAETRESVLAARTPAELRGIVDAANLRIDQPIIARDIMRSPALSVPPQTPIYKVAQLMSSAHLFVIPVVDENGRILGDITADHLFRFGLPDFFTQLKSISFIAEFEPFEAYFKAERTVCAKDLIEKPAGVVPMHYTLMEIVFDLAIRHIPQLYVVDAEDRWVGTIDQGVVLHNVINY